MAVALAATGVTALVAPTAARAAGSTPAFEFVATWGSSSFPLSGPAGLAIDDAEDGRVVAANYDSSTVVYQEFDPATRAAKFNAGSLGGSTPFSHPNDVEVAGQQVYVADTSNNRVVGLWRNGGSLTSFGGLSAPRGVAAAADGSLYVTDSGNHRVVHWSTGSTGSWQPAAGAQSSPAGIDVGPDGSVYVTDLATSLLEKYTPDGHLVWQRGGIGTGAASLDTPWAVDVDAAGRVYVTDTGGHRVKVFAPNGALLGEMGSSVAKDPDYLVSPDGVAVDSLGYVHVADYQSSKLMTFRPVLAAWTAPTITGSVRVGATLTGSVGAWSAPGTVTSRAWLRDGSPIAGATGPTYVPTVADAGHHLALRVGGSRVYYDDPVTATSASVAVPKVTSAATVSLSASKVAAGSRVTFTVAVAVADKAAAPTGKLTLKDGRTVLRTVTLGASAKGSATFTTTAPRVGTHALTVVYSGDARVAGATTAAHKLVVSKAKATVSAKTAVRKSKVSVTVAVRAQGISQPTGTVTVKDGSKVVAKVKLAASSRGSVVVTLSKLKKGKHVLTASYSGSSQIGAAKSRGVSVVVPG
ncbi:MAG: Ig-like domain repeat protein [Brevundimonas sp.]